MRGILTGMNKLLRGFIGFIFMALASQVHAQSAVQDVSEIDVFKQAVSSFERASYQEAKGGFEEYLNTGSVAPVLLQCEYYLAQIELKLHDNPGLLLQFLSKHPQEPDFYNALHVLGDYYLALERFKQSAIYYHQILPNRLLGSTYATIRYKLAYCLFMAELYDEALPIFNEVTYYNQSEKFKAHYYAGIIHFKKGTIEESLSQMQNAEKDKNLSALTVPYIAKIYLDQKKYLEVAKYVEGSLERSEQNENGTNIILNRLAAESFLALKDYKKSVDYYGKVLLLNNSKGDAELYFNYGYALEQVQKEAQAIAQYKLAALSSAEVGQSAAFRLGKLYLEIKNFTFAISAFESVLTLDFDPILKEQALYLIAKSWFQLRNFESAIELFDRYLMNYPKSIRREEAAQLLAEAYLYTSNYLAAIKHLEKNGLNTIASKRTYQKVTFKYGALLFNDGEYKEVSYWMNKCLSYNLDAKLQTQASLLMAESLSAQEQYEQSIDFFKKVITSKSVSSETLQKGNYGLGYGYFNTKQYSLAYDYFKKFIDRSSPDHPYKNDAYLRIADCLYIQKQYDRAITFYTKNDQKNGKEYANYQIAIIYYLKNDLMSSRRLFENFLEKYPDSFYSDNALFQLGGILIDLEQFESAIAVFDDFINRYGNSDFLPEAYEGRAVALTNTNNYQKAAADYAFILDQYINLPIAQEAIIGLQSLRGFGYEVNEFDQYMAKMRELNPDNKGLEAISFEQLKSLYFNEKYQMLLTRINEFKTIYPKSIHSSELNYYEGDAYFQLGYWRNTIASFLNIIESINVVYLNRAIEKSAIAHIELQEYELAIAAYKKLKQTAKNDREALKALEGLMSTYYAMRDFDNVKIYAEQIIQKEDQLSAIRNAAKIYILRALIGTGNLEEAKSLVIEIANQANDEAGAEASYLLAEIYYNEEKFNESIDFCISLIGKFGIYQEWTDRAYILLVENYMASGELLQSKATLKSILENTKNEELRIKALELSAKVEQLEQDLFITEKDTIDG